MFGFGYNNGNIGIGTTVPQYQLDVSGSLNISGNIYRDDILLSSANTSLVRKTFIVSGTQSVFDLSYNGIIYSEESEVQVFLNGYKLAYIDNNNKDYVFTVINDVSNNYTTFRVTLDEVALNGDAVDITVLPGLKFTKETPSVYQSGGVFGTVNSPINGGVLDINISLVPNAFIELSTGSNSLTINLLPVEFDTTYVGKKGKIYLRERCSDGRLLNVDNRVYFSSLYQAGYTSDVSGNPQIDVLEYEIIKSDLVVGVYQKRVEAYYWDGVNKRLGIGVSNPQYPLHVIGDTRIQGNLIINGTQTIVDTNVSTTEMLDITNDGTGPALRVTQTGVQPIADFCDDSSNNVVMRIADGGNVGIGTLVPRKKLEVVGDISCNWVYGRVNWSDISASPMQEIPVGTVVMVDSSSAVLDGTYLPLNGATLSRIDYPELANVYGIPSGQSTFTIPSNVQYQPNWTQSDSSKATFIQNKPSIVGDANGNVIVSANISAGNLGMFRNRIINGDMRIDQRNAGASVSFSYNTGLYTLDRFASAFYLYTSGSATVQRVTDAPSGFSHSYKITIGSTPFSGGTNPYTWGQYQHIEAYNLTDLQLGNVNASPFMLSFWFKANNAGEYAITLIGFNVPNYSRYTTTFTVNANTWTYISKLIPSTGVMAGTWNTTTDSGLQVNIGCYGGAGGVAVGLNTWGQGNINSATCVAWPTIANASIQITGVQLEKGTIATPFEFRPLPVELQLCQRYYENSYPPGYSPGYNFNETFPYPTSKPIQINLISSNDPAVSATIEYKVTKRTNTNVTIYSPYNGASGNLYGFRATTSGNYAASVNWGGIYRFLFSTTLGASSETMESALHWAAECEL